MEIPVQKLGLLENSVIGKVWPVLCKKSQILLGVSGGAVHRELD